MNLRIEQKNSPETIDVVSEPKSLLVEDSNILHQPKRNTNNIMFPKCAKFDRCNAALCPLVNWEGCYSHKGESICYYMLRSVKPGGEGFLKEVLSPEIAERIMQEVPDIESKYSHIRNALKRSSRRPTKKAPNQ